MTTEKWRNLSDKQRWKWVLDNQDKGITVYCDNDDTFVQMPNENADIWSFDNYIGWSDGIFDLLEVVGINAECV